MAQPPVTEYRAILDVVRHYGSVHYPRSAVPGEFGATQEAIKIMSVMCQSPRRDMAAYAAARKGTKPNARRECSDLGGTHQHEI